jgi:glyoxylase-like metal-dependent hydrolase (beta-lactamase superfamily II)
MLHVNRSIRQALTATAAALLLLCAGCDFTVQPIGGAGGAGDRTLVHVTAGKGGAPNGGIICTRVGVIVIDPMLSPTVGEAIQSQAAAKSRIFWDNLYSTLRRKPRTQAPPVMYVLNTTFRASHSFGNQVFEKADIISTTKAKERLEADGPAMRAELQNDWRVPGMDAHGTTSATLTVDDGSTFNIDTQDIKVKFISVGDCVGEGDAVVYLPAQKVLFAGDIVVPGFMPYHKGRSLTVRHWIDKLKEIEKWDIDTVVPGHGEVTRKDAITTQREFLEALLSEVQQSIKDGKDVQQTVAAVKLPAKYHGWTRYSEWLGENVKLVYRELKPDGKKAEGPGVGVAKSPPVDGPDAFSD